MFSEVRNEAGSRSNTLRRFVQPPVLRGHFALMDGLFLVLLGVVLFPPSGLAGPGNEGLSPGKPN
jgi:hypothetical protein